MKKLKLAGVALLGIALAAALVYGIFTLARQSLTRDDKRVTCTQTGKEHVVTITGGRLTINEVAAKPCDILTIINADDQLRLMAFGEHDRHTTYGNTGERTLLKDQRMTVTLDHLGTYLFHDHLDDGVVGMLVVDD